MRLSIEVTEEMHLALRLQAVREKTSVSVIVRRLIEAHLTAPIMEATIAVTASHMEGPVKVIDAAKIESVAFREPAVRVQEEVDIEGPPLPPAKGRRAPIRDFSKSAQVKGRMGR